MTRTIRFTSRLLIAAAAVLLLHPADGTAQSHARRASLQMIVTNNHGQDVLLTAGLHESASAALDAALGEQELPPVPPTEIFDARFVAPSSGVALGEGSAIDYRAWPGTGQTITENYRIRFQAGRTWQNVTLRLPPSFGDNIKSLRIDNRSVRGGDSIVSLLPTGDINIAVEYLLDPVTFTVAPASVVFAMGSRDSTLPAPQTVRVTPSSPTASWNASVSDSWIELDRTVGTGTQDIRINVTHLAFDGGRTSGSVTVRQSFNSPPIVIPVHVDMVLGLTATPSPVAFSVGAVYPNPTGAAGIAASLDYTLEAAAPVTVTVHDMLGRTVRTLVSTAMQAPGRHVAVWDARGEGGDRLAAGVYRFRVDVAGELRTRAVVIR